MSAYSLVGQSSQSQHTGCVYNCELCNCVHSLTALMLDMISELYLQFMIFIVLRN